MPEPSERQIVLTTAVPSLFFQSMQGHEEVSRLFQYDVWALSTASDVKADDLLGTDAKVSIELADGSKRWIHGMVAAFGIDGVMGRYFRYRLTLRPWLWRLTRSSDIKIFQNQSALNIVKAVLNEYSASHADETSGTPATREYCVQYRETDFNFVSRLLEDEGISYFFRHTESAHTLVLTSQSSAHVAFAGAETVKYFDDPEQVAEYEYLTRWRMAHEIQPGKQVVRDWNWLTPSTDLLAEAVTVRRHANAMEEMYDYPQGYTAAGDGTARAELRRDEHQSRFARFSAEGNAPALGAGYAFTLADHPRADQNAKYIVLSTQIDAQLSGYEAASDPKSASLETRFLCRLTAQPAAEPLKPQRITRRPTVAGPQTAIVVGDADAGDFLTDEHGRVKVQFHWDRVGQKNGNSSCWLRVASPSAGNGWGFFSLPRIGQEVVVDFLEGDPDRPLVTGRVHNPEQKTPYALPANATVSTWKSRSKAQGADKFNEIRFDDKPGSEYLLFHAQKDRIEFVEEVLKSKIDKSEHRSVKIDRKEKIEGTHHFHVVGDVKWKLDAKFNFGVVGDMLYKTDGLFSLKGGKDVTMKSATIFSIDAGSKLQIKAASDVGLDGGANVHVKGAANVVIEAGAVLTLKAGSSSVVIGPDGVSVTGPMVKLNSGGSPGSGSGASPVAPTDPEAPEDPEVPTDPLTHR